MKDEKQILSDLLEAGEAYLLQLAWQIKTGDRGHAELKPRRQRLIDAADEVRKAMK